MKLFKTIGLSVGLIFLLVAKSHAQEATEPRIILALFDSTEELNPRADFNLIHHNAERVLNWLGLQVNFFDVSKGLPSEETMKNVYGIMTWHSDNQLNHAAAYCDWLKQQIEQGKKTVILGFFGAYYDPVLKQRVPPEKVQAVFSALGLVYKGYQVESPTQVAVYKKDSKMVEFERTLDHEVDYFESVLSTDPNNKVYLELVYHGQPDVYSSAVVITPRGGFAMYPYVIFRHYRSDQRRWKINPFSFFEEAYQLKDKPRFDTTTLFGQRIFYTHIDGDGFRNLCEFDPDRYASEVILDEILKIYPVPFTVSFVASEIDPRYLGSKRFLKIAQAIWNLDNVEAGCHEFSHPLDWNKQLVSFPIKDYSKTHFLSLKSEEQGSFEGTPYKNAAYVKSPRSVFLKKEIQDSAEYLNAFVGNNQKKVMINQWSGNCLPPEEALQLCQTMNIRNINGGDSRFDLFERSYTGLSPLTRPVGQERQYLTSNANENIYTNLWSGSFYAYQNVIETFKQTEIPTVVDSVPRRVSPINVYYHFYSGEKKESLRALKKVYDYALGQPIIPLYASEYTEVVEGFFKGKYGVLSDGGIRFSNYGLCRTVRFDHEKRFPDMVKSQGILGFSRWKNYIYVFLSDENEALLYWADDIPKTPYLKKSSGLISNYHAAENEIRYHTRGFGKTEFLWAGLVPFGRAQVTWTLKDQAPKVLHAQADQEGQLNLEMDLKGEAEIVIQLQQKNG